MNATHSVDLWLLRDISINSIIIVIDDRMSPLICSKTEY